jgi:hypothetical protein
VTRSAYNRIELVDQKRGEPIFDATTGGFMYRLIQVWFKNVDVVPIRELSAEVTVDSENETMWRRAHVRWAVGTSAGKMAEWTDLEPSISLGPGEIGKLNVVRRADEKPGWCYLFADDGTGKPKEYELFGEDLRFHIHLRASNHGVDQHFNFKLINRDKFLLVVG